MVKKVAIIIVNWNGKHLLKDCLDSVFRQDYKDFEAIIIDNNSSDDSVTFVKKNYPKTHIIQNRENLGYTGGNNTGIKYALENNFEYILILNNDTLFEKEFLGKIVKIMESDNKIGVIGPLIYDFPNKKTKNIYQGYGNFDFKTGSSKQVVNIDSSKIYEVDSLLGCAFLVRREVYEKAGLTSFDEFYMYWDDYDFLQNVKKQGFKIKFVPDIEIYHICGASSKKTSFPKTYYLVRNRFLLISRHGKTHEKLFYYIYFILKFPYFIYSQKGLREKYLALLGIYDFMRKKFGKRTDFIFFKSV